MDWGDWFITCIVLAWVLLGLGFAWVADQILRELGR